jgi:Sec7-like guanine-nucleotide exchange factor
MGDFMYETNGLDKELMGEFFGQDKTLNKLSFKKFLRCFVFKRLPIDTCWRLIVNKTGLPKEGQQICRMITLFEDVYLEQNAQVQEIVSWPKDTVWTMSVKLLDLNTNLHNPNVKQMLKYTQEVFVDQCVQLLKNAFSRE